jgi:hypothetical protein
MMKRTIDLLSPQIGLDLGQLREVLPDLLLKHGMKPMAVDLELGGDH